MKASMKGCLWIAAPLIVLGLVIAAFSANLIFFASSESIALNRQLNVMFGFIFILGIFAIPGGIVMGIVTMKHRPKPPSSTPPSSTG